MPTQAMNTQSLVEKKPYQPPQLVQYGAIQNMTLGGTGGPAEGSMTTDTTRRP